jgi:hypothetical protein
MDGAVEIFMPRFMPGPIPAALLLYRMIQEMEAEREREDAERAKKKLLKKIKGRLPTLPIDLNFRGKSRATGTLLRMISMLDAWLDPPYLQDVTQGVFRCLRDCLADNTWRGLDAHLTPECLAEFKQHVRDEGPISRLHRYALEQIQFVHVAAPDDPRQHVVSLRLDATWKGERRPPRGEDRWQEFWTLQRHPEGWKLARRLGPLAAEALIVNLNRVPAPLVKELRRIPQAKQLMEFVTID